MTLLLNSLRASSVRRFAPWTGAWWADIDVDLGELLDLPTGPAVLTIDKALLQGTIDPAESGRKGPRARARVVAGGGGWEKPISPKQHKNDAAVLSTTVLAAAAVEVGERVVEAVPTRYPADFVRVAGPASQVFAGRPWHVDATGTTIVGPRVRVPAPPTLQVLDWDPRARVATIASEALVEPGTILTDARFGTAVIRDVEQTWGDGGARVTAWTMDSDAEPTAAGGELVAAVAAIAREAAGAAWLKQYRYRVKAQGPDGRLTLVPVDKKRNGLPDLKAVDFALAIPGLSLKVPPGTTVNVVFLEGDRSLPRVVSFEKLPKPLEVALDPSLFVTIGGAAALPVALATPTVSALQAIKTALVAVLAAVPGMATVSATLDTALSATVPSAGPSTITATKLKAE